MLKSANFSWQPNPNARSAPPLMTGKVNNIAIRALCPNRIEGSQAVMAVTLLCEQGYSSPFR
jgi:hypothetical protein